MIPIFSLISGGSGSQAGGEFREATEDDPAKMEIRNSCTLSQVEVTYTAMADSDDRVVKVEICKDSNLTDVVASATFNSTQPHSATFLLPADETYYAKITPIGAKPVSGSFFAQY